MGKKTEEAPKGAPLWMISYADFMALLLCFFVLLYAMSDVDEDRFASFLEAFGNPNINIVQQPTGLGIESMVGSGIMEQPAPDDGLSAEEILADHAYRQELLRSLSDDFITYFTETEVLDRVEVNIIDDTLVLTFTDMLFDSGSAVLRLATLEIVDYVGRVLAIHPGLTIRIEGHTDSQPINTVIFPSNWYLSFARAMAVGNRFIEVHNINEQRLDPVGRGEFSPVDTNDTPAGRQNNRRVEIIIG